MTRQLVKCSKWQVLCNVFRMQWFVPTKSGPSKYKQLISDSVMGSQDSCTGIEGWPI